MQLTEDPQFTFELAKTQVNTLFILNVGSFIDFFGVNSSVIDIVM